MILPTFYMGINKIEPIKEVIKKIIKIPLEFYKEDNLEFVEFLESLANNFYDYTEYEVAISLGSYVIKIIENKNLKEDLEYAYELYFLSDCNFCLNKYEESLNYGLQAEKVFDFLKEDNNPIYGYNLGIIAECYHNLFNYQEALIYGERTIENFEKTLGRDHSDYFLSLTNYTKYNLFAENYELVVKDGLDILNQIKQILGKNQQYILMLHFLAEGFYEMANFSEAIKVGIEALKILEENDKKNDSLYLMISSNLIKYHIANGDYAHSIKIGTEILNSIITSNEPDISRIFILGNLAISYSRIGNFAEAIIIENNAIELCKTILGEDHPEYVTLIANQANNYFYNRNYQDALNLGKKALVIRKKILGEDNLDYANSLNNLASYKNFIGDYESSLAYGTKAADIQKKIVGCNHPYYAITLSNLAKTYLQLGNLLEAINKQHSALKIFQDLYGNDHTFTILERFALMWSFLQLRQEIDICELIESNRKPLKNNIKSHFLFLTSRERNSLWNLYNGWISLLIPKIAYTFSNEKIIEFVYDCMLISKGILLNSEMEFDQFISETGNEELFEKYNEIKFLRRQLNKLYEKPITERHCDTDSLERHVNELERKLMDESSEYGDYTKNLSVTWEDVQKGLSKKDAAIEFVHFPLNQDSTMYMAYVLRPEMESPAMVKLFEEKELKGLGEEDLYDGVGGSKLVWEKLQSELEGVENVYFSPDGILHQIAIEYFPDYADSTRLISDRYRLNRLTSTRQIALKRDKGKTDKAIVYGGISYDTDPDIMETESRKYDKGNTRGIESYYNVADSLSGLRSGVKYLQFTIKEAENVNGLLSSGHYNPMLRSGNEATEESFKSLSGTRPGIMHIATHGFYWEEEEADRQAQMNERLLFMSQFGDNARRNVEDKALTRTGLFMAGANNALSGKEIPEDIDDGILTASEIASLDLRGTDLVVLSACQTGMGDIGGDGVFGLQRGFKKAGVNSILMSLWDVDDEATQILMTSFYQNYLNGMTKQEALQNAQKSVRQIPSFEDPEYWAAFILLDALN